MGFPQIGSYNFQKTAPEIKTGTIKMTIGDVLNANAAIDLIKAEAGKILIPINMLCRAETEGTYDQDLDATFFYGDGGVQIPLPAKLHRAADGAGDFVRYTVWSAAQSWGGTANAVNKPLSIKFDDAAGGTANLTFKVTYMALSL